MVLLQKLLYNGGSVSSKYLKFTDKIRYFLSNENLVEVGDFPLVYNPVEEEKTLIIGMFVLRPAVSAWKAPIIRSRKLLTGNNFKNKRDISCSASSAESSGGCINKELYSVKDWVYSYRGTEGGWLISNRNSYDAFRLAFQYGISDAVIVGTKTVCTEGIDTPKRRGYLWQVGEELESDRIIEISSIDINYYCNYHHIY